jgi:serine/threonine-protein kinase
MNRFSELCVLKEFFPQVNDDASLQKAKQLFEREAGVLYQLNHPQIPQFRELLRVSPGAQGQGRIFLVQDYVEGPTYQALLETRLSTGNRFSEVEVVQLLLQVLPILDYLHGIGVIHRDIAPDNLIQRNQDGLPVLIDFGGVKQIASLVQQQVSGGVMPTRLGKVGYAPEEQLETGQVSPSSDLYALAVTALVLLTGQPPDLLYDRYTKRWRWQEYVTLTPRLTKVLDRMLAPKVGDRYSSAAAVLQALNSPDTYAPVSPVPGMSQNPYEPTVAVAPGRGAMPPSTLAAPPTPPAPRKRRRSNNLGGCFQALLGLILLLGTIGLVWWIAARWQPDETDNTGTEETTAPPNTGGNITNAEQSRKENLRRRQTALQVDNQYLVRVTDQLFFAQFPDMQGKTLSDRPEDTDMRAAWDGIANEVLDVAENHLSGATRQRLGSYTAADREQWRRQVNQRYVSSRTVNDLADAKFAYLYPQNATQNFIDQPIGQIWHGLAADRARGIAKGERLKEIQFDQGAFSQSVRGRLEPGEGQVYVINLAAGQLMRLNLQAPAQSTQLSLYVPSPNDQVPFLLEDSRDRTWSGDLPQSGYYEIVVVSTATKSIDYALDVSADNVTSTSTPAAPPENKN